MRELFFFYFSKNTEACRFNIKTTRMSLFILNFCETCWLGDLAKQMTICNLTSGDFLALPFYIR